MLSRKSARSFDSGRSWSKKAINITEIFFLRTRVMRGEEGDVSDVFVPVRALVHLCRGFFQHLLKFGVVTNGGGKPKRPSLLYTAIVEG
jgi:hypothetical protein